MKQNSKRAVTAMISTLALLAVINPIAGVQAKSLKGVIKPPATSKDFKLGPKDTIMVKNEWWCSFDSKESLDIYGKFMSAELLKMNNKELGPDVRAEARKQLKEEASDALTEKDESPQDFWEVEQDASLLKPGEKETWEDCYTLEQLEAAKSESLRWAKWVKKNL